MGKNAGKMPLPGRLAWTFAQKIDTHIEKACFFEKDMLKYGLLPDMLSVTKNNIYCHRVGMLSIRSYIVRSWKMYGRVLFLMEEKDEKSPELF